jgi:hypothetical protein
LKNLLVLFQCLAISFLIVTILNILETPPPAPPPPTSTVTMALPDMLIVRRGEEAVSASTDLWMCQVLGKTPACRPAVEKPEIQ